MFIARMVFFRLHESPRYLVHAGRHREAIESLQMISKFNGSELSLNIEDVQDHHQPTGPSPGEANGPGRISPPRASPPRGYAAVVFDADAAQPGDGSPTRKLKSQASREPLRSSPEEGTFDYSSTGEPNVTLNEHSFRSPLTPNSPIDESVANDAPSVVSTTGEYVKHYERGRDSSLVASLSSRRSRTVRARSISSMREAKSKLYWGLPRFVRKPLWAWADRVAMVMSPEWLRTTLLVWGAWCAMSLGA